MQPVAIEGVPIASPTIDPASSPIATRAELEAARLADGETAPVPEGLSPLRERPTGLVPSSPDDPVIPIDAPATDRVSTTETPVGTERDATPGRVGPEAAAPRETATGVPAPSVDDGTSGVVPGEPARDGRRSKQDDTLFPLERQLPPEKPGTSRAEYSTWNDLVGRVASDRIPVVQTTDARGRISYEVPSLDGPGRALLGSERFASRTSVRLAAIHQSQRREVARLVRWIATGGRDPEQLLIVDRRARVGDAPQSVHRLMKDWGIHPDVTAALREENERRVDAARQDAAREAARAASERDAADRATTRVVAEDAQREERLAELRRRFPDPSQAHTSEVGELLRALREEADRREVERAAEAVRQDAVAREDVHRHGLDLSQAYNTILDEAGAGFALNLGRGRRGGGR